MMQLPQANSVVTVFVSSHNANSERRFDRGITIQALKERLEIITGIPASSMSLSLIGLNNNKLGQITSQYENQMLGSYPVEDFMTIQVIDTNPVKKIDFNDLSKVQKLELSTEEYEKRTDSVLAFKKLHKMGRFADKEEKEVYDFKAEADSIKVGDRCAVSREGGLEKRGEVKFVGTTDFKPGYWVGIHYDEPVGKHNGSVNGVSYFTCPSPYGAMVRPNLVKVGDYPEEDLMSDEEF